MHPLKIAYITPEAPPFSGGGIATFINNITKAMSQQSIYCEVFAPGVGNKQPETNLLHGVQVHLLPCNNLSDFAMKVADYFLLRNEDISFDIVESCEIHAALYELMKRKPDSFHYVIRVQMPVIYQLWLNNYYQSTWQKSRYVAGALRRFKFDLGFWNKVDVKRKTNQEYLVCEMADAIIAPSRSFKRWLTSFWKLPEEKISVIPHLFDFSTMLECNGEAPDSGDKLKILFVGKLNAHKGVINLAKAARELLPAYPNIEFMLIGEDWDMPYKGETVKSSSVLTSIVGESERFILLGKVDYGDLPCYYESADICIFPSLWEAWGYTCSEAMSYSKAVIGSKFGGMADAIEDGISGLLIDPFDVEEITAALGKLIDDEQLRYRLGKNAKARIEGGLSFERLAKQNVAFYEKLTGIGDRSLQ